MIDEDSAVYAADICTDWEQCLMCVFLLRS